MWCKCSVTSFIKICIKGLKGYLSSVNLGHYAKWTFKLIQQNLNRFWQCHLLADVQQQTTACSNCQRLQMVSSVPWYTDFTKAFFTFKVHASVLFNLHPFTKPKILSSMICIPCTEYYANRTIYVASTDRT